MEIVIDNNEIDRVVTLHKPKYVIIEALWVVPEKFAELQPLHPGVHWIVRLHSELPFIAGEGIAMKWVAGYAKLSVTVACNSKRMTKEMQFYVQLVNKHANQVIYLPNYYPTDFKNKTFHERDTLNIACFGAIRLLKNQLIQAFAAVKFCEKLHKKLRFHVNCDRAEMAGDPALHNIVDMFKALPNHELVCHEWMPHEEFKKLCGTMDIGLQVSLTETFNIVSADIVSMGVPIVASNELPWSSKGCQADPVDSEDIISKLQYVYSDMHHNVRSNQESLKYYVNITEHTWIEYLKHRETYL